MRDGLRARFVADGFVSNVPVFSDEAISAVRASYDELERRMGLEARMIDLHHEEPFVRDLATHPGLIDVVAAVLDADDLVLTASQFFVKHPPAQVSTNTFVAWHQDATYRNMNPPLSATAWVAIDDVDRENACLRVIRGSHLEGFRTHGTATREGNVLSRNQEIPAEEVDEGRAIDLVLKAGECSFHDGRTVHGSGPNTSGRRRCGIGIVFVPAFVEREASPGDIRVRAR